MNVGAVMLLILAFLVVPTFYFLFTLLILRFADRFRRDQSNLPNVVSKTTFKKEIKRELSLLEFEPGLKKSMLNWDAPCLDATSNVVETRQLLDEKYLPNEETVEYVKSLYNHDKGEYSYSQSKRTQLGVHMTRSALVVLKADLGLKCSDDFLYERAIDTRRLSCDQVDRIIAAARRRLREAVKTKPRNYTLIDVHVALGILKNLRRKDCNLYDCLDSKERSLIEEYLSSLYRADTRFGCPSFVLSQNMSEPCLTACHFVQRVASALDITSAVTIERIRSCNRFVQLCYSKDEKGFAMQPGGAANVVHTFLASYLAESDAIQTVASEDRAELRELASHKFEFLRSCRVEGGVAFRPAMLPNAYALRLAALMHAAKSATPMSLADTEAAIAFCNSLLTPSGGYKGFLVSQT